MSCSEIEEASPSEEVVENEETQEAVETDGENRSVSNSCRKYLITQCLTAHTMMCWLYEIVLPLSHNGC